MDGWIHRWAGAVWLASFRLRSRWRAGEVPGAWERGSAGAYVCIADHGLARTMVRTSASRRLGPLLRVSAGTRSLMVFFFFFLSFVRSFRRRCRSASDVPGDMVFPSFFPPLVDFSMLGKVGVRRCAGCCCEHTSEPSHRAYTPGFVLTACMLGGRRNSCRRLHMISRSSVIPTDLQTCRATHICTYAACLTSVTATARAEKRVQVDGRADVRI